MALAGRPGPASLLGALASSLALSTSYHTTVLVSIDQPVHRVVAKELLGACRLPDRGHAYECTWLRATTIVCLLALQRNASCARRTCKQQRVAPELHAACCAAALCMIPDVQTAGRSRWRRTTTVVVPKSSNYQRPFDDLSWPLLKKHATLCSPSICIDREQGLGPPSRPSPTACSACVPHAPRPLQCSSTWRTVIVRVNQRAAGHRPRDDLDHKV